MHETENEPSTHTAASAEVALYHRASMDVWRVWLAARYLLVHRSDIRYFRLYEEHGPALFDVTELVAELDRPGDTHLSSLMPLIEAGLVVIYARPFTTGWGSGYPVPEDVVPSEPELRQMHEDILRLRNKVYAHIDDTDSPAPRTVERFRAVDDDGVERERYQEKGSLGFTEGQLDLIVRLALAVGRNLDERLTAAKRRELAGTGRCAECGRKPRPDENSDDEWRAESDGTGGLHVLCPGCWERAVGSR